MGNRKESFLPFVDISFRSRDMSFQSLGNLEKKCEKKIEHLCSFNKSCDVKSRTSTYSIFKSNVIQVLCISQFQAPTSPLENPAVLHLFSARVSGFVPSELSRGLLGIGPIIIIKVPNCQLMLYAGTYHLFAALFLQNLFQNWGKTLKL